MPTRWRTRRREHYSPRAHDVATRTSPLARADVVPEHIDWKVRPGETIAHAFSSGPGWMRSVCRALSWTVALVDAPEGAEPCGDCALLVDGAPGEITEAYG